jgi:hypothetical protein
MQSTTPTDITTDADAVYARSAFKRKSMGVISPSDAQLMRRLASGNFRLSRVTPTAACPWPPCDDTRFAAIRILPFTQEIPKWPHANHDPPSPRGGTHILDMLRETPTAPFHACGLWNNDRGP